MDDVAKRIEDYFPAYVEMGNARSLAKVATALGVSILAVTAHARVHNWTLRLRDSLARDRRIQRASVARDVAADVNREQIDLADKLIEKARAALENVVFDRPQDVLKALQLGAELKRQATGVDEDREGDLTAVIARRLAEMLGQVEPIKPADAKVLPAIQVPTEREQGEFKIDPAFLEEAVDDGDLPS